MVEAITLEFLAGPQRWVLDKMASMRDDIRVLTATALRHEAMPLRLDETLNGVLEQMRAMVTRNARVVDRLRAVDERGGRLKEQYP
jgi:hypothetical protein